jgi:hypothetical protein
MGSPISQEIFLARARARFGEAYDYSRMVYKSFKTPIKIRCTTHPVKEISITPEKHLQTTGGCKFCLREKRIRKLEYDYNVPCPAAGIAAPPADPFTTTAEHQDWPATLSSNG